MDLTGSDCRTSSVFVTFLGDIAVGTYTVSPVLQVGYVSNSVQWGAGYRGGSGSVIVSSVSGTRVSGTFAVEMVPDIGTQSGVAKSVQGNFDLLFHDKKIC